MAIEFECPTCGATIRVKDDAANKNGRCPKCKTLLLVPDPEADAAPVPSEQPASVVAAASPVPKVPPPVTKGPPTVIMPRSAVPPEDAAPAAPPLVEAPVEPVPVPPATVFGDPALPFAIAAEPEPLVRPEARRPAKLPIAKIASAAAGLLAIGLVILVGWFLYRSTAPDLSGSIAGDRLVSVSLEPVSFAVPTGVSKDAAERVMVKLKADDLSLKSEYVEVTLKGAGERVTVAIAHGPQASPVRVPLGRNPAVKAALAKVRKSIEETKREELETGSAELFRDYDAYLNEKKPLTQAPRHRDAVALNATTGPLGYAVEAVIADYPFRCVAEDDEGRCYFLLPARTKRFRIRGRDLPDGTTPLPVNLEVTVREVAEETVGVTPDTKVDEAPDTEPEPGNDADSGEAKNPPDGKGEPGSPEEK